MGASFCAACGSRLSPAPGHPRQSFQAASYGRPVTDAGSPPAIPKQVPTSWKRMALVSIIAVGIGLGLAAIFYAQWNHQAREPERRAQARLQTESKVKFGVSVQTITASSLAERSGLHPGDIITGYAGLPVRDVTSYTTAVEAQPPDRKVTLTVWRDNVEIKLTAPGGPLGFMSEDWNPVRKSIYDSLSAGNLNAAGRLAAEAERDGSLTEVQSLIVKIMLIPNRAPADQEKQRSELLDRLFDVYPKSHLNGLAYREFFTLGSYAAAARSYEEMLQRRDPEDVNVRLNLAICYVQLFEFDKAERHVRYIVDRPDPQLSAHGHFVARTILGGIASGRGSYREALKLFSQDIESGDDYTILMCMLAAAKLGDLEQVQELRRRVEKLPATDYGRLAFRVNVIEAYALAGHGRSDEAAALIKKWGSPASVAEMAARYWSNIPGGTDVPARMQSLPSKS